MSYTLSDTTAPELAGIRRATAEIKAFDTSVNFNEFARRAVAAYRAVPRLPTPSHATLLQEIASGVEGEVIPTSWGGVAIRVHEHPRVEKYLVVKEGTWLAFEWHTVKDETLETREGTGLLVYRRALTEPLELMLLTPGVRVHLPPTHEHCVIALHDLVVYETGTDPLGMDKDLQFIHMPE